LHKSQKGFTVRAGEEVGVEFAKSLVGKRGEGEKKKGIITNAQKPAAYGTDKEKKVPGRR